MENGVRIEKGRGERKRSGDGEWGWGVEKGSGEGEWGGE